MNESARTPIVFLDIGAGDETVQISCWLVDQGHAVAAGDRVVEVRLKGVTFDIAAPAAGTLCHIERYLDMVVSPGDVLGWIEPAAEYRESHPPDA